MPSRKRKATLQASVAKRWARGVETVDDAAADSSSAYQFAAVGAGFVGGGNRCFLNATLQHMLRAFASFLFFIVSGRSAITNKFLQLSSSGAALDAGKQQRQALLGLV